MDAKSLHDEKQIARWGGNALLAYLWVPFITALLVIPLHEAMHYIGGLLEGGTIDKVVYLNTEEFLNTFFFFQPSGEPLGKVIVSDASGLLGLPPGTIFYALPYIIGFGLGAVLLFGDNIGLPNWPRIIGAPLIFYNFLALPNEYALATGTEPVMLNAFLVNAVYIVFVLIGVTATTIDTVVEQEI